MIDKKLRNKQNKKKNFDILYFGLRKKLLKTEEMCKFRVRQVSKFKEFIFINGLETYLLYDCTLFVIT
jgi:hypothetical protein